MKIIADTNLLVRAVTVDDEIQGPRAAQAIETATAVIIPTITLCELVWVLRRGYRRTAPEVAGIIRAMIETEGFVVERAAVEAGLASMEAGGDFADGVIAFEGERLGGDVFVSFDTEAVELLRKQGKAARSP
jgi:predicted nucleic-acid-binding protein